VRIIPEYRDIAVIESALSRTIPSLDLPISESWLVVLGFICSTLASSGGHFYTAMEWLSTVRANFFVSMGFCEQKALRQSEAHLAHGKKVGRGLHALGDSTYAVAIRKVENPTGYRLLQWFISAASDEFAIKSEIFPRPFSLPGSCSSGAVISCIASAFHLRRSSALSTILIALGALGLTGATAVAAFCT
jgi:hypothetical protein